VLEGHRLAQSVAHGDRPNAKPASSTPAYERQADPTIELLLERVQPRRAPINDERRQTNPQCATSGQD